MSDTSGSLIIRSAVTCALEYWYMIPVSGSTAPPCQFTPPVAAGRISVPRFPLPSGSASVGGV